MSVFAFSCGGQEVVDELPEPVDIARVVVEENLADIDEVMSQGAREAAVRKAIAEIVEAEALRPFLRRVEGGLRYSTVFQRDYVDGEIRASFVDEKGLTERGAMVVEHLENSWRHGIDSEPFHLENIEAAQAALSQMELPASEEISLSAAEVEGLVQVVAGAVERYGEDRAEELLMESLSIVEEAQNPPPVLQRLRQYHAQTMEEFAAYAHLIAELELWVADGALRYAREMRHSNLKRMDWREMRDAGGSTEIILGRMQETLQELSEADAVEVSEVFLHLEPSHQQYRALLTAATRYRGIAEDGGWQRVRAFTVELGAESDRVEELRIRLEIEGFDAYPEEVSIPTEDPAEEVEIAEGEVEEEAEFDPRVVDESLIEGIRRYQQTHQFRADGEPTHGFWKSLNLSVEERIEQMELTLQRWRESYYEDDQDFIMVNIPDFHAEVWTEGERKMRFEVVVGRNNRVCDRETGKWDYPNATPVLMSKMDHIILNPSWYVPSRLEREQLRPKVEEDPDYYEKAGYEEMILADGREVVRQLPGPTNALGRVKFLFPNEHNVYLHDTPDQHYFDYVIRNYSSGCIRVSEPLELAKFLFEWDGQEVDIDEVLETTRTRQVNLNTELPVIAEYYTVWIDDDGLPNFLADIYRKDAQRRSEEPEEYFACSPRARVVDVPELEIDGEEEAPADIDEDLGP